MPIIAKDNRKEFTPAPEGLHQGVCVDVIDLGMTQTPWGEKQKVELRWQIDTLNPETAKRFLVMQRYTLSLNEKATLRHHLEAWRGKKFTNEELAGFDLEKLVGANCQIQIVHNLSDQGRVFANVQALVPIGKGMVKMRPEDYVRAVDRQAQGNGHGTDPDDGEVVPF